VLHWAGSPEVEGTRVLPVSFRIGSLVSKSKAERQDG